MNQESLPLVLKYLEHKTLLLTEAVYLNLRFKNEEVVNLVNANQKNLKNLSDILHIFTHPEDNQIRDSLRYGKVSLTEEYHRHFPDFFPSISFLKDQQQLADGGPGTKILNNYCSLNLSQREKGNPDLVSLDFQDIPINPEFKKLYDQ